MAIGIISQALVTTLLPRTATFSANAEMHRYVLTCLGWAPFVIAPGFLFWMFAAPATPLLLGRAYAAAQGALVLIVFSSLLTLTSNPLVLILLAMGQARLFALTSAGLLAVRTVLCLLLIPSYGALGAALADLLAKSAVLAALTCFMIRRLVSASTEVEEKSEGRSANTTV
jgi:O-antigen/teichoic acid export membrane protein